MEILQTCLQNLTWSHILTALRADSETSIRRYSILKGNEQLFAAKYLPLLPSEEDLKREIEKQKEIFNLQYNIEKE